MHWWIQDFPEVGAPAYVFAKFPQKLHEIERIWTLGESKILLCISTTEMTFSGFSQRHKIGNNCINSNYVTIYTGSFLLYLQHIILVNMKLDNSGCNRITFQGPIHWSSSFLTAQLKQSWQYYHSYIVKTL